MQALHAFPRPLPHAHMAVPFVGEIWTVLVGVQNVLEPVCPPGARLNVSEERLHVLVGQWPEFARKSCTRFRARRTVSTLLEHGSSSDQTQRPLSPAGTVPRSGRSA